MSVFGEMSRKDVIAIVLDMCAAPGSKTAQLLDMLGAKSYSAMERQVCIINMWNSIS